MGEASGETLMRLCGVAHKAEANLGARNPFLANAPGEHFSLNCYGWLLCVSCPVPAAHTC